MDSRNIAAGIINNNREPRGSFFLSCTIMKFKNKQERRKYTASHPSLLRDYNRKQLYSDRKLYLERLDRLERFFMNDLIPKEIRLSEWEYINDTDKFIGSTFSLLRGCNNSSIYEPYLERIEKLKEVILNHYFKQKTQTNGNL